MFKKSPSMKFVSKNNSEMPSELMNQCDFTLQEKLEIILERPNYSRLRDAEDAAASDSE